MISQHIGEKQLSFSHEEFTKEVNYASTWLIISINEYMYFSDSTSFPEAEQVRLTTISTDVMILLIKIFLLFQVHTAFVKKFCPEKREALARISLSRQTITRRIETLSQDF